MGTQKVQAAGTVLWREVDEDAIEIAVIHRPKYMDWSLPIGKLNNGESHIAAAYRETLEETGFKSKFGPFLGTVDYKTDEIAKEDHITLVLPDHTSHSLIILYVHL